MTRARDLSNLIGSGNYSQTTLTATAGQTSFTVSHTPNFVQVFMNGLLLDPTVDFTANGTAIVLTEAAAVGDELEVVTYETFSVGDAITQTAADTRYVLDTADTITVSGGKVGIGKSTPTSKLDVHGAGASIRILDTSTVTPNVGGALDLAAYYTGTSENTFARIEGNKENATDADRRGYFSVKTRSGGSGLLERMRIDSSGNVGIGTSSPAALLDLKHNSASTHLRLTENTSGNWSAFGVDTSDNLRMYVNNTERMRIDASGHVTTPYQPSFMVSTSGDTAFTAAQSVWTDFSVFGNVDHNRGNHWNTSTRRFTCPVAGVYHFYINVREETYYGSWGGIRLQLVKNGVRFAEIRKWDGYQNEETLALALTIQCAANDIVHSRIHSDSSDTSLSVEGSETTFFGGYLVG